MRHVLVVLLLVMAGPVWANGSTSSKSCPYHLWAASLVPPDAEFPVVVEKVALSQLFARGHATMEMEPWALEAFGPKGAGMGWMDHIPNGTMFIIPFSPQGQWQFFPQRPQEWSFAWGANPALDRELEVLAPLARRLAQSTIDRMGAELADRKVTSNGNIVVVKNSFGMGARTWHQDHQWDSWDARAIGVMPFGVAKPTQAYFDQKAYTPPPGNLVVIESHTWHRGIPTPDAPRAIITVDLKVSP